jgi:hypothetical protein
MLSRPVVLIALFAIAAPCPAAEPPAWWPDAVEQALTRAKDNRPQLEKALGAVPQDQRKGMAFLIEHMPERDLRALTAEFLLENVGLAYRARKELPWGKDIPEDLFLNDVLPYANVDETRDPWREEFFELCLPLVKGCKTPGEAAQRLNTDLFKHLKLGYSTQRRAPNQGPRESITLGNASCTGLSIVLADACRSVCVPARLVGTPLWADKRGNHTWVEVWDKGWHFTGACEADPQGLDRGWFVGAAAQAKKDVPQHAIYAASYKKTGLHFPLVWAPNNRDVPAENVTDRYAKPPAKAETFRLQVKVVDGANKRVARAVTVTASADAKAKHDGTSRDETADANNFLSFDLPPDAEFVVTVGDVTKTIKTGTAGKSELIVIQVK